MTEWLRDVLRASDVMAVLTRELPVRVLNVSGSGCLIESATALEEGTIASLRVSIDGEEYTDDVRMIRCRRVEGAGSTYHVGAEFLWTTPPGTTSLRRVLRMLPDRLAFEPAAIALRGAAL